MAAIDRRVEHLLRISGISVNNQTDLISQLFAHLAPAVEYCCFDTSIGNMLLEEMVRKYPRLMRTAREWLFPRLSSRRMP